MSSKYGDGIRASLREAVKVSAVIAYFGNSIRRLPDGDFQCGNDATLGGNDERGLWFDYRTDFEGDHISYCMRRESMTLDAAIELIGGVIGDFPDLRPEPEEPPKTNGAANGAAPQADAETSSVVGDILLGNPSIDEEPGPDEPALLEAMARARKAVLAASQAGKETVFAETTREIFFLIRSRFAAVANVKWTEGEFIALGQRAGLDLKYIDKALREARKARRPALLQWGDRFIRDFEPPSFLIEGLLRTGYFYSFTAKTGTGKTALMLYFAAKIASGQRIGDREVERGRVIYFAGENADDVRQRWIAAIQQYDLSEDDVNNVAFIPDRLRISEIIGRLKEEVRDRGPIAIVMIDTSATYFEQESEDDNVQALAHAKMLRSLTELDGNPTVLAATHPKKNAPADELLPRGGGSFLNETDANFCATLDDVIIELHWQGKIRGADFAPILFRLYQVTHERLIDKKGRRLPTVIAREISENDREELLTRTRNTGNSILSLIQLRPEITLQDIARDMGWANQLGEPDKSRAQRVVSGLVKEKLLERSRGQLLLTKKGEKEAAKAFVPPAEPEPTGELGEI